MKKRLKKEGKANTCQENVEKGRTRKIKQKGEKVDVK